MEQAEKDVVTEEEVAVEAENEAEDIQKEMDEEQEDTDMNEDILDADDTLELAKLVNAKYVEFKEIYDAKLVNYTEREAEAEEGEVALAAAEDLVGTDQEKADARTAA